MRFFPGIPDLRGDCTGSSLLRCILQDQKSDIKNVSLSAGLNGLFGITAPAIYGVTLRLKKPFICGSIGGATGAIIISFFHSMYYVYAGLPGLLTTVNAISNENPNSFIGMLIGVAATIVITIVLIQVVGCDEKTEPEDEEAQTENKTPEHNETAD